MPSLTSILALGLLAAPTLAQTFSDGMGPAAFMWPSDREWAEGGDRKAPCGSTASIGRRTKFPLSEGSIALVAQHIFYNTKISISFDQDPKSNDDFKTLVDDTSIAYLEPGHTCFTLPDAPSGTEAGANATLQFSYHAVWDSSSNETFYACADITYAEAEDVSSRVSCFNVTVPGRDTLPAAAETSASSTESSPAVETTADGEENLGGRNGLPGAAAAGFVVAAAALFAL